MEEAREDEGRKQGDERAEGFLVLLRDAVEDSEEGGGEGGAGG